MPAGNVLRGVALCLLLALMPTATGFAAAPGVQRGPWSGTISCLRRGASCAAGTRTAPLRMADPWDLTPRKPDGNEMFSMPNRNQSKTGEATETLRRDFQARTDESQALPGFLRGALDPLRLKRNVKEARIAYLARMLKGEPVCVCLVAAFARILKPRICLPARCGRRGRARKHHDGGSSC